MSQGILAVEGFYDVVVWLVVSTPSQKYYSSQNGNLPQLGVQINNIWNHHPVVVCSKAFHTAHLTLVK